MSLRRISATSSAGTRWRREVEALSVHGLLLSLVPGGLLEIGQGRPGGQPITHSQGEEFRHGRATVGQGVGARFGMFQGLDLEVTARSGTAVEDEVVDGLDFWRGRFPRCCARLGHGDFRRAESRAGRGLLRNNQASGTARAAA